MTATTWIGVAALGGVGAILRFLVDGAISARVGRDVPIGTLVVNASGSFVLGLLVGATVSGDAALLAGTATVGSYTTFSTWLLETHRLGEDGEAGSAAGNIAVSLAIGLGAAALGRFVGGHA